jgi:hypothetical protein
VALPSPDRPRRAGSISWRPFLARLLRIDPPHPDGASSAPQAVEAEQPTQPPKRDAGEHGPSAESTSAEQAGGSSGESGESGVEKWIRLGTTVVAPTTVLTALLLYFGYVATSTEFGYFGITLGTLGLSTQDLALRSIGALYVPLGGLLVLLLLATGVHAVVSSRLDADKHQKSLRRAGNTLVVLGGVGVIRGIVGVVLPEVARTEPVATSPLSLGLGVMASAYGWYLRRRTAEIPIDDRRPVWSRHAALAFIVGLVTLSLFWATSSFAGAYGRGRAMDLAGRLSSDRPAVVLDTTERLFADYRGVEEMDLPAEEGQRFRYRYYGFRLLVQAEGRMFLVPEQWRFEDGTTLVLTVNDDVRFFLYD